MSQPLRPDSDAAAVPSSHLFRALAAIAMVWLLAFAAAYASRMSDAIAKGADSTPFVLWIQIIGCACIPLLMHVVRPNLAAWTTVGFFAVNTLVFVAWRLDPWYWLSAAAFSCWLTCVVNSMRILLVRWASDDAGTWGVAGATLFAVLVPADLLIGLLKLATPVFLVSLGFLAALPGAVHLARHRKSIASAVLAFLEQAGPLGVVALELIWLSMAATYVWAFTDEIWSDSMRVYIPYIRNVAHYGGLVPSYAEWYRLVPMPIQLAYGLFFAVGGLTLAKVFSWMLLPLTSLLCAEEAYRRSGQAGLSLLIGAAVQTCPLLMHLSTSLYIDHGVTLLATVSVVMLLRAYETNSWRDLCFASLLAGCLAQVKLPALAMAAAWGLATACLMLHRNGVRNGLLRVAASGALVGATASPWYLYTWRLTGNPFFPFFNKIFQSPYWENSNSADLNMHLFKVGDAWWEWIKLPWVAGFQASKIVEAPDGALGFWLMALAPFALALAYRRNVKYLAPTAIGLVLAAAVCVKTPYMRYWLPAYPMVITGLLLAAGQWTLPRRTAPAWVNGFASVGVFAIFSIHVFCWMGDYHQTPWKHYELSRSARDWREKYLVDCYAVDELNRILGPTDGVLCTGTTNAAAVAHNGYSFPFWYTSLCKVQDAPTFEDFCRRERMRYWLIDRNRAGVEGTYFNSLGLGKYQTPERIVAAENGVVVYDLQGENGLVCQRDVCSNSLVEETAAGEVPSSSVEGWRQIVTNPDKAHGVNAEGLVVMDQGNHLEYVVAEIPHDAEFFYFEVDVKSDEGFPAALIDLTWFDAAGAVVRTMRNSGAGFEPVLKLTTCGRVPEIAQKAIVRVAPYGGQRQCLLGSVKTVLRRAGELAQDRCSSLR